MTLAPAGQAAPSLGAARSARRSGAPDVGQLHALLDELGADDAAFVLVCYSDGADHEALARVMDRRTEARGVAVCGLPQTQEGMSGFALRGDGMRAAIEVIPQLDQLSLLALDAVPKRLMRGIGRELGELKAGRHAWLTLYDAQSKREPFLTPLISRWAPLELVGGSIASPKTRQGTIVHHGRCWRNAAAVVLLESSLPMRAMQHTHLELTERWLTVTRLSADGLTVEALDGRPACEVYAEALGVGSDALTSQLAARHPFGLRFRGRAFPVAAVRLTAERQLRMGVAVPEGERLNLLRPVGLVAQTRAQLDLLARPGSAMLLFDCVNRLTEASACGELELYREALSREQACVIHSYGEQYGYMHLNCSMTGLVFDQQPG